ASVWFRVRGKSIRRRRHDETCVKLIPGDDTGAARLGGPTNAGLEPKRQEIRMENRFATVLAFAVGLTSGACKGPGSASTPGPAGSTKAQDAAPAPEAAAAKADDTGPIKVGILHSLSGTMAISETSLKDVALMTIEQINQAGGVLKRKIEPVVVDPASNWPLFAEKARELLQKEKVAAVFGCWTSVSRKSVLPVFEELNGLLFYPVQYEGEESSYNVFYTGAAPNQQAIPAVEYLMSA